METSYTTFEIAKALEIPRERLQDWIKRGFVKPTQPAKGQGTKAGFTRIDVYGIALFQELLKKGLKRNVASKFVKEFIHQGLESFAYVLFKETEGGKVKVEIFSPGKWGLSFGDKSIDGNIATPMEVGKDWRHIHVVNLDGLRGKIDRRLPRKG